MGAWGNGPFDNDTAADFVYDFEENGVSAVAGALDLATDGGNYLELPEAEAAIAAAAFVVAAGGHTNWLSEPASEALAARSDRGNLTNLKPKARQALQRIQQPNSEWMELWSEAEPADFDAVKQSLNQLMSDLD